MDNWPRENPDFYKINCSREERIKLISNGLLEEEFYKYANNFRESAHIITQDALDSQRISVLDINFFGLAFLYRHSIELILKGIGFKYILDTNGRKKFIKETFHNLYDITNYISRYIDEFISYDRDAYEWVLEIFRDMNCIDKESDSFRYPFGIVKERKQYYFHEKEEYQTKLFFPEQTHINLFAFASKMEIIFSILDSYYNGEKIITNEYKQYSSAFLETGGEYYCQSVIGYKYNGGDFHCNVKSYKNCADIILKSINKDDSLKARLFMPFCYLYRNSIELIMKQILFEESSYNIQEALEIMSDCKHKLYATWKAVKKDVILHSGKSDTDETLILVEKYIIKINEFDGKAARFRYPIDKDLNLYYRREKFVDFDNVRDFFEDVFTFFDCVCNMMSVQNEQQRVIEYECYKYY